MLRRGGTVLWGGVLSFITPGDKPPAVRVFWLDPIRVVILGCRLAGGEARLIMRALDGVAHSAAAVTQCEPGFPSDQGPEDGPDAAAVNVGKSSELEP